MIAILGPTPIASGRDADIFAIDDKLVLRRYRAGGDVAPEARIMAHVASQGFPAPEVHSALGADMVMERLHGPTMLEAMAAGDLAVTTAAVLLADLHRRLHELPAARAEDPAVRVLHLDLHPDNVVLSSRGPVVID